MMTFESVKDALWWSTPEIAEFFGVSNQTVKRWIKTNSAPVAVIRCMEMAAGYLPANTRNAPWYGWRFKEDKIWSPQGDYFHPADLMTFTRYWQYVSALESKIRELEKLTRLNSLPKGGSNNVVLQFPTRTKNIESRDIA